MNHPPVPAPELEDHIDRLKANEGVRFSQEYESIDPGQQFTWEASNHDGNKAKNRYAQRHSLRPFQSSATNVRDVAGRKLHQCQLYRRISKNITHTSPHRSVLQSNDARKLKHAQCCFNVMWLWFINCACRVCLWIVTHGCGCGIGLISLCMLVWHRFIILL